MNERNKKISKMILKGILITGAVAIASTSPYFVTRVLPKIIRHLAWKYKNKKEKRKFTNAFYYLKNRGLLKMEYRGKQLYISLTEEGKKAAKKYQIDDMKIKKPKKWDKRWHVLIFDIKDKHKIKREALRGKIKELGLFQLQKSVWACPWEFHKEIAMLRDFFGLTEKEMNVIKAFEIEGDMELKKFFKLD